MQTADAKGYQQKRVWLPGCRLWKAFNTWRKAIRDIKSSSSTEKLSKGLLLLDPLLQQAVYAIR
jgi:hypothetical protein